MTGVMNASLNEAGNCPTTMERLNNSAMYGAIRSITCFKTDVGIGSTADDLSGRRRTALITSSTFTNEKVENETPCRLWLNVGSAASLVLDRTLSTFSVKHRLIVSTSIAELAGNRPRLIKRQLTSIAFEDPIDQHRCSYARTPHFYDDIADDPPFPWSSSSSASIHATMHDNVWEAILVHTCAVAKITEMS